MQGCLANPHKVRLFEQFFGEKNKQKFKYNFYFFLNKTVESKFEHVSLM